MMVVESYKLVVCVFADYATLCYQPLYMFTYQLSIHTILLLLFSSFTLAFALQNFGSVDSVMLLGD